MAATNKEFRLSHVFKGVSKLAVDKYDYSPDEMHFNVPWKIGIVRKAAHLGVFLYCEKLKETGATWSIDTEVEMTVKSSNGKRLAMNGKLPFTNESNPWGWDTFISWDTLTKDYLVNDSIAIEAIVNITKMTGNSKNVHRFFDKSTEKFSDEVIDVKGTKFYVLRTLLASHSKDFNLQSSYNSIFTFTDINAADFQALLEVLYGESAINDNNVDGVLQLAVKFSMALPIQKCIEFLSEMSAKPMADRFKLAKQYKLVNLKTACISNIRTLAGLKAAMAIDSSEMDAAVLAELLKKSVALQ